MPHQLEVSRQIQAPIADVFARLADFPNAADTISAITEVEMLTPGPVGEGTRFRETRVMYRREATEEMEVIRFEPPHGYTLHAENHGTRYLSAFILEERDGGTHVRMTFEATPLTLLSKIMSALMKPMMKALAREVTNDLADVAKSLENGAGTEDEG